MTVAAIGEVIKKPFQYLEKFVELMRTGADVPFTDESVATRRIYKDGEKVKRILEIYDELKEWGLNIYDKDILDDLFRKLPPGSMETKDVGRYAFKDIEYQSITNPKKIEVLSLNKIGKQVVSGRGGDEFKSQFSGKESDWTETLTCYALALRQDKGSDITEPEFHEFLMKGVNEDSKVLQIINQNVVTNKDKRKVFLYGMGKEEWRKSGVNVANALYKSPYLKSGVNYDFYFGGTPEISWFKSKWYNKFNLTLQNYLRRMNNISNDVKNYGSSVDDKWNPADIFAVAKNLNKNELRTTTMGFFAGDMKEWKKFTGKKSITATDEKVQADMAELARYNSWIHENILNGTLIPISLKKALNQTSVQLISNPSIEEFHVEVTDIRVDWVPTAAKIYIHFKVIYTTKVGGTNKHVKKSYNYFFDCRNFNVGENVQFELGAPNSSAKHGKISVGPAEMIIDMTSSTIKSTLKQKRTSFVALMRKQQLSQEPAIKSFEQYVANKNRFFIDNTDINHVTGNAGWPTLLGEYIKFLSGENNYDLNKSDKDLKNYFKSKIASVELGWVMSSSQIQPIIKNNVLKSLYLYAASHGLQIFDDSGLLKKSYFYNSSYVKVRD